LRGSPAVGNKDFPAQVAISNASKLVAKYWTGVYRQALRTWSKAPGSECLCLSKPAGNPEERQTETSPDAIDRLDTFAEKSVLSRLYRDLREETITTMELLLARTYIHQLGHTGCHNR